MNVIGASNRPADLISSFVDDWRNAATALPIDRENRTGAPINPTARETVSGEVIDPGASNRKTSTRIPINEIGNITTLRTINIKDSGLIAFALIELSLIRSLVTQIQNIHKGRFPISCCR